MALTPTFPRMHLAKAVAYFVAPPLVLASYLVQMDKHNQVLKEVVKLGEESVKLSNELKKERRAANLANTMYFDTRDELENVKKELDEAKKIPHNLLVGFGVGVVSIATLAAITFQR